MHSTAGGRTEREAGADSPPRVESATVYVSHCCAVVGGAASRDVEDAGIVGRRRAGLGGGLRAGDATGEVDPGQPDERQLHTAGRPRLLRPRLLWPRLLRPRLDVPPPTD